MFLNVVIRIFLFVALLNVQANADLVVQLADLPTMAIKSDKVLHGVVVEQTVQLDRFKRPTTLSKIKVKEGLYGIKTGDIATVYQVGGKIGNMVMPIVGGQEFRVDQEVIFFGLDSGEYIVSFGQGQGKLDITPSPQGRLAIEDLGNVGVVSPVLHQAIKPVPDMYPDVELLKQEIRKMVKQR
jgi:hypothetical protein